MVKEPIYTFRTPEHILPHRRPVVSTSYEAIRCLCSEVSRRDGVMMGINDLGYAVVGYTEPSI